jgi:hypothetical protein
MTRVRRRWRQPCCLTRPVGPQLYLGTTSIGRKFGNELATATEPRSTLYFHSGRPGNLGPFDTYVSTRTKLK